MIVSKKIIFISTILLFICSFSINPAFGKKLKRTKSGDKLKRAKNVIIMISDGAGYNTHLSTEYWHGGKEPYDSEDFKKYPVSTYNLRKSADALDNNDQDPTLVYDHAKAWDDTPAPGDDDGDGYLDYFEGYKWLQATDPDSAGTMSAMVTGLKVYRGGINVDGFGNPLLTAPEVAKAHGKSTDSISTVRYNHATPAAGGGTISNKDPATGANLDLGEAPVNPGDDTAGDPFIPTVPTLVDMTKAAINHLDRNPKGFYLSIEGGACDWAMHGNSMARMIEEHTDFNNAVQAVIDYLDANTNGNNWDNTLLIVTSDHDHNLYGPDSDINAFEDVSDNGPGNNPGHIWHDNNHGNQLVPAWVRGFNTDKLEVVKKGIDPVHGLYIDQVDLGQLMLESIGD